MNDKLWKPHDVVGVCIAVSLVWLALMMLALAINRQIDRDEIVKHHSGYFNPVNGDTFIYRECGPLTLTMP